MKKAICHYSFHRLWEEEQWDVERLCDEVKKLGVGAVDFHAGLLGDPKTAAEKIKPALARSGLALSALSLSTNFLLDDEKGLADMMALTREWLRVAADVGARVSRIFGGSLKKADEPRTRREALRRIIGATEELVPDAEKLGVVLAMENHGVPGTAMEQVEIIERVGSDFLRATVDVGNYVGSGQEGLEGTRIAAPSCAYVHLKDMRKVQDSSRPRGWSIQPCVLGRGDVQLRACLEALKDAGYDGYVALEYEAPEPERVGVQESLRHMARVMEGL